MYKNTNLIKEQYDFLVNWCSGLKITKQPRPNEDLKLLVEYLFFYICGDDVQAVMNAAGIKGDRRNHNISSKHLKEIRSEHKRRDWYNSIEERLKELDYRDYL